MQGEVEGVMQAINKKPDDEGNQLFFDKNDLGLLEMVASLASSNMHNTIEFNQQLGTMNSLRNLLRIGVGLFRITDDHSYCMEGRNMLKQLFFSSRAQIYIVKPGDSSKVYTIEDDGEKKEFGLIGILGSCMEKKQVTTSLNSQSDPDYNGKVA